MWKSFVICGVALAALVAWDLTLTSREEEERRNNVRVGRLFTKEEREGPGKEVKGLMIENPAGDKFIYKKVGKEEWRCTSYKNAVASAERIERGLLTKIFETEGHVQSDDSKDASQYGLDVPSMFRVSIHGNGILEKPERSDLIGSVDVGAALHEKDGCFMRRTGLQKIWTMDGNPHPELDRPPSVKLPPLLDMSMIPAYWLASAQRVKNIKVEFANGKSYELEVRDKQISMEDQRQGKSPFEWYLKQNGKEQLCQERPSLDYTTVLMRAPFMDIIDYSQRPNLGFDNPPPAAKLTLFPAEGKPMELYVGSVATQNKQYAVYNTTSGSIYECQKEIVGLLFPQESMLLTPGVNPWEQLLKMMNPR